MTGGIEELIERVEAQLRSLRGDPMRFPLVVPADDLRALVSLARVAVDFSHVLRSRAQDFDMFADMAEIERVLGRVAPKKDPTP